MIVWLQWLSERTHEFIVLLQTAKLRLLHFTRYCSDSTPY